MARPFSQLYLRCQLIGWSSVLLFLIGLTFVPGFRLSGAIIWLQFAFCLIGLLATHLLRIFIRRRHYLYLPFRKTWPRLLLATAAAALIGSILDTMLCWSSARIITSPPWIMHQSIFVRTIGYLLFFVPWTTIYWLHFHILLQRKLSLEDRRLELLLKEKESSAAGPTVDIDFITGSLDRIRSLIDEDPDSARIGINTFSQILRNGRLKTD